MSNRIASRRVAGGFAGLLVSLCLGAMAGPSHAEPNGVALYKEHCASCHGADRLGGTGPALIPQALVRLKREAAAKAIAKGRAATQMPGFAGTLADGERAALVDYIYGELADVPRWTEADISASRVFNGVPPVLSKPVFDADPLNLFVVVETGDHHVTILDGDSFTPIYRIASRFALHGGPKFTRDGRFVFFASRDGWVTKFDLWELKIVAEVRAGINTRNIAISQDARHVAVANYLPHTLVMLSAEDLSVEKILNAADRNGTTSRVSAVYQAPPRNSFIAALKDVPEIWEISTDPNAPPQHAGFVHSYEKGMVEALAASKGLFALRRIEVEEPLDDFFFDQPYRHLLGSARDGKSAVVVNLNVGRSIGRVDLPGLPHLGAGITFDYQGKRVMATPHLKQGKISVIRLDDWSIVKQIETPGPGFFMRSHEGSRYAWTDVMMSKARDTIQIVDKTTLEIARTLTPSPGKTAAHVEFDRYGKHALVSVWEDDGALVVYDAETFKEVKRIPMRKPSGKYNVFNKITFSEGTSH
ncbi:MAG: cytochrome D1 domain-containing protein [Hyphomicrobiaceae bacterium]